MKKSYSQAGQDKFVYALLKNKNQKECVYLELGANRPIKINNTYNLELLGWKGLSIDICCNSKSIRENIFIV